MKLKVQIIRDFEILLFPMYKALGLQIENVYKPISLFTRIYPILVKK